MHLTANACKKLIDLRRKTVFKICQCIVDFLYINAGPSIEIAEMPEVQLIPPFPVKDSFPNVVMSQHIVPRLANAMLQKEANSIRSLDTCKYSWDLKSDHSKSGHFLFLLFEWSA